jgi:hypothetical protein
VGKSLDVPDRRIYALRYCATRQTYGASSHSWETAICSVKGWLATKMADFYVPGMYSTNHRQDYHDYPECAQPCLLNETGGYWWTRCERVGGQCCPGARPSGVRHFEVWDCVLAQCAGDDGHAQESLDIFMRECARYGHPLPASLGSVLPSSADGDRLPAAYTFKDFGRFRSEASRRLLIIHSDTD